MATKSSVCLKQPPRGETSKTQTARVSVILNPGVDESETFPLAEMEEYDLNKLSSMRKDHCSQLDAMKTRFDFLQALSKRVKEDARATCMLTPETSFSQLKRLVESQQPARMDNLEFKSMDPLQRQAQGFLDVYKFFRPLRNAQT